MVYSLSFIATEGVNNATDFHRHWILSPQRNRATIVKNSSASYFYLRYEYDVLKLNADLKKNIILFFDWNGVKQQIGLGSEYFSGKQSA